ncbi:MULTISPECIES: amino acid ABC transporter permease [Devosia]|uniref:Inner membrane amino-acid ABC transporter permease protein YhdY n=1 Tax=Devosia equisanguinis TaxID=2490941 RepID=A0A3S4CE87_9HYPH|nr:MULTISPECIES: amino acid ABC transporter permease [Devosia]ODT49118.1 MAG: amino acid ABC transporter permease [Pelagibacterium sp. SCN 63-126]ODU83562.1 MAG: amino acid ABC transporter permease [Pelagibacterium sp. SCN 63-17]OJX43364.1 MAG: amino acid ABC transporter permease [Devosia sp. 63-57]VDS06102.1 Inner membrane amino-acid ABC transporter permease protein YhdY [Devosia equisanguinis]
MTDIGFVRSEIVPARPAPIRTSGIVAWARKNLFATPLDSVLTVLGAAFLLWVVPPLYGFFFGNAVGPGGTVEQCRLENAGACWAYIAAEMNFFIYGFYPVQEFWRPNLVFALGALLLTPMLIPKMPFKRLNAVLLLIVYPIVSYILLAGGLFGLRVVPTEQWGGLLVTLIISVVGITLSFPMGIVLALGRQSNLPIIKTVCIMFIELIRAVPLITILFMASVMLPLFMPQGMTVDKFLRALVGVTLFTSAYMAEVVRGGLQAIPRGQYEAAAALGLGYWRRMWFIILPQALKHVIPGIVNNFISLFKDTSLVYIVGMRDLLEAVKTKNDSAIEWQSANTATTGYIFAAMVFWVFCFGMSRYSIFMERRLNTGYKR